MLAKVIEWDFEAIGLLSHFWDSFRFYLILGWQTTWRRVLLLQLFIASGSAIAAWGWLMSLVKWLLLRLHCWRQYKGVIVDIDVFGGPDIQYWLFAIPGHQIDLALILVLPIWHQLLKQCLVKLKLLLLIWRQFLHRYLLSQLLVLHYWTSGRWML